MWAAFGVLRRNICTLPGVVEMGREEMVYAPPGSEVVTDLPRVDLLAGILPYASPH